MNYDTVPDTIELFRIGSSEATFVGIVKQFQKAGFDFNGLCAGGDKHWPIGKIAIIHGDRAIEALADAGYRFDHDDVALEFSKKAFYGSRKRAAFLAAHRHNRWIDVPSVESDIFAKAQEAIAPCFCGFEVATKPPEPKRSNAHSVEMKGNKPMLFTLRIFCVPM